MNANTQVVITTDDSDTNFQHIPLNQLIKSKENTRTISPDKASDKALIASINAEGLLSSLVVKPSEATPQSFEVIGGGRRLSALQYLVSQEHITVDYLVPCTIKKEGSAAATSLAENLHAPTHMYDQFIAYQQMIDDGMNETEIGAHFNLKVVEVKKLLKLAQVHPTILKTFSKDKITLDAVMAFTIEPSKKAQLAVFKTLGLDYCSARRIRDALTEETTSSKSAIAKFVGLNAYETAGGSVLVDMFKDEKHMMNQALLVELAEKKLVIQVKKLEKEGWSNIKSQLNDNIPWHELDKIKPDLVGVPDELTTALENATKELEAMHESEEEWTDSFEQAYDQLAETITALQAQSDEYRVYSDEDKERCHCIVAIDENGKALIERGLILRCEMKKDTNGNTVSPKPKNGLSQALLTELGHYRQQIVQVHLAKNAKLANDLLLYTLGLRVLGHNNYCERPIDVDIKFHINQSEPLKTTNTYKQLNDLIGKLPTDWLTKKTPQAKFEALQALSTTQKQRLLAYCVAQSLDMSLSNQSNNPLQEIIVDTLSIDFAKAWRPNAENYFKRLNRDMLLKLGQKLFSKTWASNHANKKKSDIVAALHNLFNESPASHLTKEQIETSKTWLPEGFLPKIKVKRKK